MNDGGDQVEVVRARRQRARWSTSTRRRRPLRPRGHGARRRRHHLAGRHRRQQRRPADGGADRPAPRRYTTLYPADLPRRAARRRGAAARSGRHAVHRHQGGAGRQRGLPARTRRWPTAARSRWPRCRAWASRSPAPPGAPWGGPGSCWSPAARSSADGQQIALRTYTDAYVWPLTGSDVVGALAGAPVRIPLPDSPQGEAISFAANNRDLLVVRRGAAAAVTLIPAGGDWPPPPPPGRSRPARSAGCPVARSVTPLTPASSPPWPPPCWSGSAARSAAAAVATPAPSRGLERPGAS